MEQKTVEDLRVDWIVTQNIVRFQELLKRETNEGRYRILANLLAGAFGNTAKTS
jgi:hypothetical protein